MEEVGVLYSEKFFLRRGDHSWRAPIVCESIINTLHPRRVVDFGCGDGDLVAEFTLRKIKSMGIEGTTNCSRVLKVPQHQVLIHDLRTALPDPLIKASLSLSFEVAEHIEEEYAEVYVDNLTKVSKSVLMSAAPPGQGGHGHVNCQRSAYWERIFNARGYHRIVAIEEEIKRQWEPYKKKAGIRAYYNNLLFFQVRNEN
jgi:hypothetical protein